jgi:hypothetical protein
MRNLKDIKDITIEEASELAKSGWCFVINEGKFEGFIIK